MLTFRLGWLRTLMSCVVCLGLAGTAVGGETAPALEDLQSRLAEIESAGPADDGLAEIRELYRRSIRNLESAAEDRAEARRLAAMAESAPQRVEELEARLRTPPQGPEVTDTDPDALEQALVAEQSDQAALRRRLDELRSALAAEQRLDLPDLIADAQRDVSEARDAASSTGPEESSEASLARQALRASTLAAAEARVERLNQQRLSRSPRLHVAELEQRLLTRQIDAGSARIGALQQALSAARAAAVEETSRRNQARTEAQVEVSGANQSLAAENAERAERIGGVFSRIDGLAETEAVLENDLARVSRYLDNVKQQLAVAGAIRSAELGMELLTQWRELARDGREAIGIGDLDQEITSARLENIRLDELRFAQRELTEEPPGRVPELEAERLRLLRMASSAYDRYIEALTRVRSVASRLMDRTDELQRLLDSRLFWTPTARPFPGDVVERLGEELDWLLAPEHSGAVAEAVRGARPRDVAKLLLLLALTLAAIRARPPMRRLLARHARKLDSLTQDRARYTWTALAVSVAFALPLPLILAGAAVLLGDASGFPGVLALGLKVGAMLLLGLETLRHICRRDGLGRRHFGWSDDACSVLRRNLPWLAAVVVPTAIFAAVVDPRGYGPTTGGLSRVSLSIASVALAVFAHRVLRPGRGVLQTWESDSASGWRNANRYLLHPSSVAAPLGLVALSWSGYHFSALVVESRLLFSVAVVVSAVLLYDIVVRGVSVSRRRVTARQVLDHRRVALQRRSARRAAGDAAEGLPEKLQQLEQAPEDVDNQARALVRMLMAVGAAIVLWGTWSDLLPAFDVLNEVVLWTAGEGAEQMAITLGSLLAAAVLGFLTYFAARNVAGTLEVALFSRMQLQPGTAYAVKTVITYLVVLTGSVAVLNMVGAQWSKLQWLVAALGVGLGFGLQEIVANFVSGLLILFERPIRVGDTVTVSGITGTVTRIRIRATTITDWDRKEQIIPNKTFITTQLTNWTLTDPITRVIVKVAVAYGSDVELTHRVLIGVIDGNARVVREPPPAVFFVGFGESSLNFEMRVFIQNMLDMMPLIHELHTSIVARLEENGIRIPYPQRDIRIVRSDAAA